MFDFNIKGYSGKLKTSVIGDYLLQKELLLLEKEREEYFAKKGRLVQDSDIKKSGDSSLSRSENIKQI